MVKLFFSYDNTYAMRYSLALPETQEEISITHVLD